MRRRNFAIVLGACLVAALTGLTTVSAFGDPTTPSAPPWRFLNGVGSDTTQGVMNALSDVVLDDTGHKQIASWDAATAPGQTITTRGDDLNETAAVAAAILTVTLAAVNPPPQIGANDGTVFIYKVVGGKAVPPPIASMPVGAGGVTNFPCPLPGTTGVIVVYFDAVPLAGSANPAGTWNPVRLGPIPVAC